MNRDTLIAELKSYAIIQAKISAMENDIKRLERLAYSTGNSIGDGMPHARGGTDARYTKIIERMHDTIVQEKDCIEKMLDEADRVTEIIMLCPNQRQRDILELRYRYCWTPKKISIKINKSERNVYSLHDRGIDAILRIYNEGSKK